MQRHETTTAQCNQGRSMSTYRSPAAPSYATDSLLSSQSAFQQLLKQHGEVKISPWRSGFCDLIHLFLFSCTHTHTHFLPHITHAYIFHRGNWGTILLSALKKCTINDRNVSEASVTLSPAKHPCQIPKYSHSSTLHWVVILYYLKKPPQPPYISCLKTY